MNKKVAVIGASLGGLIAAAELKKQGCDVSIIEKAKTVGGLYNKIETPFGMQEVGMHVLYVNDLHFAHLSNIFGAEIFHVLTGCDVDIGACANFGSVFYNSLYPNLLGHPQKEEILSQLLEATGKGTESSNALEEAIRRFGLIAGKDIVAPILKKLWQTEPELLTKNALHCFFDLRRIVICEKAEADKIKSDPWLDDIVANPIQTQPHGEIFGGRMGLTFKTEYHDLSDRVNAWANREGVNLKFKQTVAVENGCLLVEGAPVHENYDACIIALPMHSLASEVMGETDKIELSVYYFELTEKLQQQFPTYYILCHSEQFKSSRIVNYDGYNQENTQGQPSVLAVEALHEIGAPPQASEIADEIMSIVRSINIKASHRLERSIPVCSPSLKNAQLLDSVRERIAENFASLPAYFTGMRTDTGIFFSHHTIGLAYESALECSKRLS